MGHGDIGAIGAQEVHERGTRGAREVHERGTRGAQEGHERGTRGAREVHRLTFLRPILQCMHFLLSRECMYFKDLKML